MEKNIGLAVRKYEEAAAEGHVLAMNALGSLFYNDLKDHKQAAEWFRKASEKGCARSLNNMATCFEFGHGVPVDRDQAYQLYKESALKGHTQAMLNLAYLTNDNARLGKNQDQYKESAFWFRKLTIEEPDRPQPYFQLAQMHEHGLGCVIDMKSAFQYYRKAARLDHIEALTKCGDFIYSGKGLDCKVGTGDRIEAMKCYRKAADLGSSRAMNSLALMLEAVSSDTEALTLYKLSHKLGNLDATINMALMFLKGCSTEVNQNDLKTARTLLSYAFHQGAANAGYILVQYRLQSSITGIVWDAEDQEILAAIEAAPSAVQIEKRNSQHKATSRTDSEMQQYKHQKLQSKDLSQGSSMHNPLTYSMQQSWLRN